MRFEAKHTYFKSLSNRMENFNNISKTLANRHQLMMSYYLSSNSSVTQKMLYGMEKSGTPDVMWPCVYGMNIWNIRIV